MAKQKIGRTVSKIQDIVKSYLEDTATTIQSLNLASLSMSGSVDMNDNDINNTNTVTTKSITADSDGDGDVDILNGNLDLNNNKVLNSPNVGSSNFSGDHSDLSGIGSSDHHAKYTDTNAQNAVTGSNHNHDSRYYRSKNGHELYLQDTEPSNPSNGDIWIDTS